LSDTATSPAASGPAGAVFEGQVGAHYLLTLLAAAEPRGLPGASIDRIEFQRASDDHALDDVIVKARDRNGRDAVLEIQVKHAITFAPSDPVFRKVVAQIAQAAARPDFHAMRYELAIATARDSWKISGAYQHVLSWARQLQSAGVFMARIKRQGLANKDMRTFVETFRANLAAAGAPDDDETVWKLLRRLQILVFDFTATGSASEALAQERAIRVLAPSESHRAPDLWSILSGISLDYAAGGGELDAPALTRELTTAHTFRLAPDAKHTQVRELIAEASQNALRDIDDSVGGVRIARDGLIELVRSRFEMGRYLEIRGDGGVGKSSLLKHFVELVGTECRVLVLTSKRTPAHGWLGLRAQLGFEGTARALLSDLAADGAAFVFVDGLDDFTQDEQRRTVVDLMAAAADVPGVKVLATARNEFGRDEPSWLPEAILKTLGISAPVVIDGLSGSEVDELREADGRLAELLADQHPAQARHAISIASIDWCGRVPRARPSALRWTWPRSGGIARMAAEMTIIVHARACCASLPRVRSPRHRLGTYQASRRRRLTSFGPVERFANSVMTGSRSSMMSCVTGPSPISFTRISGASRSCRSTARRR
jgi:hypothetical protein